MPCFPIREGGGGPSFVMHPQELLPRGLDIVPEELGDLVDKEMAATTAAIQTATARIEVPPHQGLAVHLRGLMTQSQPHPRGDRERPQPHRPTPASVSPSPLARTGWTPCKHGALDEYSVNGILGVPLGRWPILRSQSLGIQADGHPDSLWQEMLSKSREGDTGAKLEVNERSAWV